MIANITIKWFFELPGVFITAGVLLILISIIVFIVTGAKAKKLAHATNEVDNIQSTTNENVETIPQSIPNNGLDVNTPINGVNSVNSATLPEQPVQLQSVDNDSVVPGKLNLNSADIAKTVIEPVSVSQPVMPEPVFTNDSNPIPQMKVDIPTVAPVSSDIPTVDTISPIPEIIPIPEVKINSVPVSGNEIDGTTTIQPVDTATNSNDEII